MLSREVLVHGSAQALFEGAAQRFLSLAEESLERRGHFRVALAGGSTPKGLYLQLAEARLPWDRIDWFWGDERCVPREHPDSNHRMAWEALLSRIPLDPARVHRVETEHPDAAGRYEATLKAVFGEPLPRFDLILLGMGTDGHTASLFPGCDALEERERLVVATQVPGRGERITLTFPVLDHAARVMFLVSGAEKREALKSVLSPGSLLPAARVQAPALWMVDRAAFA